MSTRTRKWLSRLLRAAFCAAAVAYLYTKVSWYDYATLATDPHKSYRVLDASAPDRLLLEDPADGRRFDTPRDALATRTQLAPLGRRPIEPGLRGAARLLRIDWAAAALLVMAPTTFLMGWRLRYLLAIQSVPISLREAVLITFAGNFFNFALPGTTGGDLYKAYHVARHAPRRTEAVTIVFLDRAIGVVSFVFLAAICIALSWREGLVGRVGKLVGLLLAATIVGSLIFFSRRFRRWIGYEALLQRLPMAERLRRVDRTAFSFRYHPWQTGVAMAVTMLNNVLLAAVVLCLCRAVGMSGGHDEMTAAAYSRFFLASMLALSVGYLAAAIPISVQGFGLLEAVFLRVLAGGGWGTGSQVVAVCLATRLVHLVWSLPGIVVPWLGLRRPPTEAAEVIERSVVGAERG